MALSFLEDSLPTVHEMDSAKNDEWVNAIDALFRHPNSDLITFALSQYSRVTNDRAVKKMICVMWITLGVAFAALVVSIIPIFVSFNTTCH